jgi:hypothetical protein
MPKGRAYQNDYYSMQRYCEKPQIWPVPGCLLRSNGGSAASHTSAAAAAAGSLLRIDAEPPRLVARPLHYRTLNGSAHCHEMFSVELRQPAADQPAFQVRPPSAGMQAAAVLNGVVLQRLCCCASCHHQIVAA